jgi:hypothetical protein
MTKKKIVYFVLYSMEQIFVKSYTFKRKEQCLIRVKPFLAAAILLIYYIL